MIDFADADKHPKFNFGLFEYCETLTPLTTPGSCAPSLLARAGRCYQWSPVDGSELELACNTDNLKARFVCEMRR